MRVFKVGETVVRRDVHRGGGVWSELALRVVSDTSGTLVTACAPGAEARWPSLYAKSRHVGEPGTVRAKAFDAMAAGQWELGDAAWRETELLLWKPPGAWLSINAFYTYAGMRNWYVNFERPTVRTSDGFDTFDLTVDLVIDPDLGRWHWKDEDEYAHVRRLGIITDLEHRAVEDARGQILGMLAEGSGPFADAAAWRSWRWNPDWPNPRLPIHAASSTACSPGPDGVGRPGHAVRGLEPEPQHRPWKN